MPRPRSLTRKRRTRRGPRLQGVHVQGDAAIREQVRRELGGGM